MRVSLQADLKRVPFGFSADVSESAARCCRRTSTGALEERSLLD